MLQLPQGLPELLSAVETALCSRLGSLLLISLQLHSAAAAPLFKSAAAQREAIAESLQQDIEAAAAHKKLFILQQHQQNIAMLQACSEVEGNVEKLQHEWQGAVASLVSLALVGIKLMTLVERALLLRVVIANAKTQQQQQQQHSEEQSSVDHAEARQQQLEVSVEALGPQVLQRIPSLMLLNSVLPLLLVHLDTAAAEVAAEEIAEETASAGCIGSSSRSRECWQQQLDVLKQLAAAGGGVAQHALSGCMERSAAAALGLLSSLGSRVVKQQTPGDAADRIDKVAQGIDGFWNIQFRHFLQPHRDYLDNIAATRAEPNGGGPPAAAAVGQAIRSSTADGSVNRRQLQQQAKTITVEQLQQLSVVLLSIGSGSTPISSSSTSSTHGALEAIPELAAAPAAVTVSRQQRHPGALPDMTQPAPARLCWARLSNIVRCCRALARASSKRTKLISTAAVMAPAAARTAAVAQEQERGDNGSKPESDEDCDSESGSQTAAVEDEYLHERVVWQLLMAVKPSAARALHSCQLPQQCRSFEAYETAVLQWPPAAAQQQPATADSQTAVEQIINSCSGADDAGSTCVHCGEPGYSYEARCLLLTPAAVAAVAAAANTHSCIHIETLPGGEGEACDATVIRVQRAVCAAADCIAAAVCQLAAAGPPAGLLPDSGSRCWKNSKDVWDLLMQFIRHGMLQMSCQYS